MKIDRYTTGIPKFRVFRHVEDKKPPDGALTIRDEQDNIYAQIDPFECFVLKRRDLYSYMALFGYMTAAWIRGDTETAEHIADLMREWHNKTEQLGDAKIPD